MPGAKDFFQLTFQVYLFVASRAPDPKPLTRKLYCRITLYFSADLQIKNSNFRSEKMIKESTYEMIPEQITSQLTMIACEAADSKFLTFLLTTRRTDT